MRVFITGGAGFIGSHLCDALINRGDEVSILDNLSTGSKGNIAHLEGKITVHEGDIRDKNLIEKLRGNVTVIIISHQSDFITDYDFRIKFSGGFSVNVT